VESGIFVKGAKVVPNS